MGSDLSIVNGIAEYLTEIGAKPTIEISSIGTVVWVDKRPDRTSAIIVSNSSLLLCTRIRCADDKVWWIDDRQVPLCEPELFDTIKSWLEWAD